MLCRAAVVDKPLTENGGVTLLTLTPLTRLPFGGWQNET